MQSCIKKIIRDDKTEIVLGLYLRVDGKLNMTRKLLKEEVRKIGWGTPGYVKDEKEISCAHPKDNKYIQDRV